MGKSNKKLANRRGDSVCRPDSLSAQLTSGGAVRKNRAKNQLRERKNDEVDSSASAKAQVVDQFLSEKILKQARKQQNELQNGGENSSEKQRVKSRTISFRTDGDDVSDDDESENFDFGGAECYEPVVTEEEERVLARFMTSSSAASTNQKRPNRLLADIIMEKIDEKRFELESRLSQSGATESIAKKLDPRVVRMYQDVGRVLSTYRSGKLPKPLKIVPKLTDWEEILYLTEPEKWTAAAMYQATRIFVSNLNVKMCQRFLSLILLPRIRDDIAEYKKLNFHLYQALGKALFKPAAFFKAILLPLCQEGNCTLREAMIIGSLLTKCSVPSLHAAAAMLKIAEMDYSGANSLFLRVLVDKKYTLPYRVVDGLVSHFLRFVHDDRNLPVLWHQSLLAFCQRYKSDLSSEQREHLLELICRHFHAQIGPEIRRELVHAQPRDAEDQQQPIVDERMSEDVRDWSD